MAKATTTIRQVLNHKPDHGAWFAANQGLFNQVATFYFEVIQAHRRVLELGNKEALTALELLTHATEKKPTPVMPLSDIIGVEVGDMLTRVELFDLTLHKLGAVAYPAVLSEYQPEQVAVLLVATGIGAGIIADGSLYRGAGNSAGEWGHMTLELDGRLCRCGSRGCLEAYAGAPGIIASLREMVPRSPLLHENDQESTLAAIVDAARNGDFTATQVLKDTAHYLGVGIANLINLFNPQLILLGGWAGLQIGESILPELRQCVDRYALKQPLSLTRIDLCADWGRQCQGLMEEIPWITRVQAHRPQHTIGRG